MGTFGDKLSLLPYRYVATITVICTFILMLLGSYTSAIGAGLSCPDWPKCYGVWIPFLHPEIMASAPYSSAQIFAEWAHRGLASIVGVLIIVTVILAWNSHRHRPSITWSATLALLILPIQVAMGGLTVTRLLEPVIVTSHLGLATLVLVSLVISTVSAWAIELRDYSTPNQTT